MARRFNPEQINHALDARFLGPDFQLAVELGVSHVTLRKIRRGEPVHPAIAYVVLEWIAAHPPTADAERLIAAAVT